MKSTLNLHVYTLKKNKMVELVRMQIDWESRAKLHRDNQN